MTMSETIPAMDDGTNWEAGDASLRQLKFDLDELGFTGYALYTDKYLEQIRDIDAGGYDHFLLNETHSHGVQCGEIDRESIVSEYAPYIDRSIQQDLDIADAETRIPPGRKSHGFGGGRFYRNGNRVFGCSSRHCRGNRHGAKRHSRRGRFWMA